MSDLVKVTVLLPKDKVRQLDEIAKRELRGSRGRAIEGMIATYWYLDQKNRLEKK